MTQSVDDITRQARRGSVAAIIQILNDRFADAGIRTRAMLADGALQLLCEAKTAKQLDQTATVEQIRQILESLSPRNISKVNINARIVREQQLLWLEEISRNPEEHLLWSELIVLKTPHLIQRWREERKIPKPRSPRPQTPTARKNLKQLYFWRGLMGGASLCLFLLLLGWVARDWWASRFAGDRPNEPPPAVIDTPESPPVLAPETVAESTPPAPDPFVQAVRLAEAAAVEGQAAQTAAEWLDLASRWQRASDLMAEVSPEDNRYPTAQDRASSYQKNSEAALQQVQRLQAE
ncbi:MAG: hypothetical protein HC886_07505 [Leptolyngbyaceae cyanobacterium SM1_1_3]|nr:hypothetical protein [Leptolyngbyaceae cyanobacterium SM1_1_3]NJN01789.1 hypothetical protein [Leptolyngbyaceae cyanobacterium RM1_1_2]